MFGDETRSNIVWWPNAVNVLLSGETVSNLFDHRPNELFFPVFDQMFVDVPVISHTIKQGV